MKKIMGKEMMIRVSIKHSGVLCFFAAILMYNTGCVCSARKELNAKNKEMENINLALHFKEKTIADLLDRLSMKDQEIGRLADELQSARVAIDDLKSDIEKLREIDVQVEEKKKEVDNSIAESIPRPVPAGTQETEPTPARAQNDNK
ncbi:MAG: hypothetical protein DCC43_05475 [Candidatus Brocadia sp.]|nr:hypothetical protein [Candidatus Brocadia fulgida]MCC6324791.1 hypothetical protein [Candidatus Brocadia sp.]MCE7911360.1 hypothetical protein [Candidatus Brocadia sp. AMX3]MDG5995949.1 hypothetical protein [Candidatus Brocadia sp.]RIK01797.1 MAG: hypothetical protein DCC43_05475 [Candidatus Brocadia sp.]